MGTWREDGTRKAERDEVKEPVRQEAPSVDSSATVLYNPSEEAPSHDPPPHLPVPGPSSDLTGEFKGPLPDEDVASVSPGQTGEIRPVTSNPTCDPDQPEGLATPLSSDRLPAGSAALEAVVVPGYQILEELGRGGMGVVYKARHLGLNRVVALKMILAGAHAGAKGLARFRAEAEAVAQLRHPNIVQIYETGEHEGRPYFSLEYVEAGSLEQRLLENRVAPRAAAEVVKTLALAMEVAHQHGIVHRDLKPANILLAAAHGQTTSLIRKTSEFRREHTTSTAETADHWSRTTVPKIADFGLAKRLDEDAGQTQSGTIVGTPSYMAPEQADGRINEIGPATDIYSLGAICYEMLAGRPPFKAGNPIDTIRQVIGQEPVPPRQLEPRVPTDLETICLKCLEKDPGRRYTHAVELADDLRRFLNDEPILARPTPAWERAWKWSKRRPAIVALIGVSAVAALALVLLILWYNVSLGWQLAQARAEERLAREREQAARERERLSRVESEGQKLFNDARLAATARDWTNARLHLGRALATVGEEPGLEKLKSPIQALLTEVEQHLRVEADRRASLARFQQFGKLRDDALFLGCLYTGMDLAANLKATRTVVHQALAAYGVAPGGDAPPTLDAYLSDSDKKEIRADCYQLLLILAETETQLVAEGTGRDLESLRLALGLLQQALRFGPPSRAYHLRQERYLKRLGDEAGARRAEKAAAEVPVVLVLDHFLVGDEYYRRARFEDAIKEFNAVLQQTPNHFWAQYLNALCLLRLHRPVEARAQLTACLAQRSDFVWIYLLRGFAQGELQAFGAAEADYQKALQMSLDENARYVLLVNRGVLRVRQERFEDAIADLKKAIELKPKEYQAHVNLAQAYRRQEKMDLALEHLHRAIGLEPSLAHLYRLRARLHLERKEPTLALEDFDRVVQKETASSPFLADDHVERGRLLLMKRKYPEALASFDAALGLRKEHSLGQRLRAETLFQLGGYREVIEAFDRYLEMGKPLESVYRGRGLARAELGKYPGAIEDYTRALELHPTSTVQVYRGWAYLLCEAPKLALRDFELAVELDRKNADAYSGRGFVLALQGRLGDAVRDAEEALRLGPQTPRLVYNAARILAQCGVTSEQRAMELIQKALGLLPAEQRPAFWSRYVRMDAALQALHRNPQFQRLEAELSPRK